MLQKDPKARSTMDIIKLNDWILDGEWYNDNFDADSPDMDLLEFQEFDFMKKATQTSNMIGNLNNRVRKMNLKDRANRLKKKREDRMQKRRTRAQTHYLETRRSAE